jgi:hypothetical protein
MIGKGCFMSCRKSLISVSLFTAISLLLSASWLGCGGTGGSGGGGETVPEADSITDASDKSLDGATDVDPTQITLAFNEEMNTDSLNNITITCGILTPTFTIAATSTVGTYTITITDAWRYALLECTLTIPTSVTSKATGLANPVTYTFTNKCAVSDDFNSQSISDEETSCWVIQTTGGYTLTTWAEMSAAVFTQNSSNSTLDSDFTDNSPNSANIYKEVTISDEGFEVVMHFKSISNYLEGEGGTYILTNIVDTSNLDATDFYYFSFGITGGGNGKQYCTAMAANIDFSFISMYAEECNEGSTGYYLKLSASGDTILKQYKVEGGEYQDIATNNMGSSWPDWDGDFKFTGADRTINITNAAAVGSTANSQLDYIETTGFSVTDQY